MQTKMEEKASALDSPEEDQNAEAPGQVQEPKQQEAGEADADHTEPAASTLEHDDDTLDQEAEELLAELARSQLEVKRMLGLQKEQAQQLGGLKEQLAAELQDLQDENWKMEVFGELEALKQQLSTLNGLEGRLDASESILDATDTPAGSAGPQEAVEGDNGTDGAGAAAAAVGGEEDLKDDYNPEEIAELQAQLDAELADMFSQLQAVKSEASEVSMRKVQLERELQELLAQQVADDAPSIDQNGKTSGSGGGRHVLAAAGEVPVDEQNDTSN